MMSGIFYAYRSLNTVLLKQTDQKLKVHALLHEVL